MNEKTQTNESTGDTSQATQDQTDRRRYEAPKMTKKKSVASVTLFSGGGATAGGLTAAG